MAKVTTAQKIEALEKAVRNLARYREHDSGCAVGMTEFCTCGLREAMEVARMAIHLEVEANKV